MKIKAMLSTAVLAVAIVAVSGPAYAAESPPPGAPVPDGIEYTFIEPLDATLFIDGKPTNIAVMPDFDPSVPAVVLDGEGLPVAVSDIKLVHADGKATTVLMVNTADKAALSSCWRAWSAPGTGTWYYSVNGCSFIGMTPTTKVGYQWTVDANSLGSACLKGRGYFYTSWPNPGYVEFYGSIGCGGSGSSGGGTVNWGEVASTKRVQMQSTSTPVGAAGMLSTSVEN